VTGFYNEVFGWTSREMDMGPAGSYTIFQRAGDVDTAGAMPRPEGMEAPPLWWPYIAVDDADATASRTKELGGNVVQEPFDVETVGRIAILADPNGAVFGVIKPTQS
jgi:predicted enzyme related to lactoylglutathione lyase